MSKARLSPSIICRRKEITIGSRPSPRNLVKRNVDVILAAGGTPAAIPAKNATRTIPVVFVGVADPVGQGIVASLARPGGNVTGISSQQLETAVKSLALLKEIIPSAKRSPSCRTPQICRLPR